MKKKRVLVDQDGSLNRFSEPLKKFFLRHFPHVAVSQDNYYFAHSISDQAAVRAATDFMNSPGFYRNLPAVPEALRAYQTLVKLGHDVAICTHPVAYPERLKACMQEKVAWTVEHLGTSAAEKIIFSFDKTRETADVIIDDKPDLTHQKTEIQFRHWLIVDHPYNRTLPDAEHLPIGRLNNDWSNWEEEFAKLELI